MDALLIDLQRYPVRMAVAEVVAHQARDRLGFMIIHRVIPIPSARVGRPGCIAEREPGQQICLAGSRHLPVPREARGSSCAFDAAFRAEAVDCALPDRAVAHATGCSNREESLSLERPARPRSRSKQHNTPD